MYQGVSFGVADGVGGWATSGVDPSLFSQALMYHSHRYAKVGWVGEPEVDTTQDYEDREAVEGWELHPRECLKLAYQATLRERAVVAGQSRNPTKKTPSISVRTHFSRQRERFQHRLSHQPQRVLRTFTRRKVRAPLKQLATFIFDDDVLSLPQVWATAVS
jgi:hypothetical protein